MKVIILFSFVAITTAAQVAYYTTGNDRLDVDALIANRAEIKSYLDCFYETGSCSDLALSYKKNIKEAVEQACRRCNDDQKILFWRFLQGIKVALPEEYWHFRHFYDPENKYFDNLEKEISKIKPVLAV